MEPNKNALAKRALEHTNHMAKSYAKQIKTSTENTVIYNPDFTYNPQDKQDTKICLVPEDTVSALFKHAEGNTTILNFASYTNPGGGFLSGSTAQEECLCHRSFLYNVLVNFKDDFYELNKMNKNRALYTNRALFTPDVVFSKDNKTTSCNVITCAAPNWRVARRLGTVRVEENHKALINRILFILNIAAKHNTDTLIIGAFGCGVFGQNTNTVAKIFKLQLKSTHKVFKKIVIAVPDKESPNYKTFEKVFSTTPIAIKPKSETIIGNYTKTTIFS